MQNDKYKTKLNVSQLSIVISYVERAAMIPVKSFEHKLIIANMICIHKKLIPLWNYPKKETRVVFTACEAIAFWVMFHNEDFIDPLELATMTTLLNEIEKQFI